MERAKSWRELYIEGWLVGSGHVCIFIYFPFRSYVLHLQQLKYVYFFSLNS